MIRRWRGMADVPLNRRGRIQALRVGHNLGRMDAVYYDSLSRCRDTGEQIKANIYTESQGPLPWHMGHLFQGREITEDSLNLAKYYIYENPRGIPPGGECFLDWEERWVGFLRELKYGFSAVGIVTHNRNIQYLYATQYGKLSPQMYDVEGPSFCTVHCYDRHTGYIAPWGGLYVPNGIYIVRHGETEWGT